MPYLRVTDGDLYYQRIGDGSPIVFINDWVLTHNYWQDAVKNLSRDHCCVVYDPRGVGRSQSFEPTASYSIETHAEDLHELIISLRSGLVHLMAHGLGAMVAGLCLRAHPQDAQTLSLIAAEADMGPDEVLDGRLKYVQALIVLRKLATVPLIRGLVLRRYSLGQLPPAARKIVSTDFAHLDPRAAWQAIGTALDEQAFKEYIAGISQTNLPVLLVAGGRDNLAPVEHSRKLFARIQRGRLATIHSAGHFPMIESPPKFCEILRNFLNALLPHNPIEPTSS